MDGLRLRVLYRVFQRFAFRAVFVDLLHVRVDECEVVVIQVLIEEHLERACGGDALGALVGAGQHHLLGLTLPTTLPEGSFFCRQAVT